MIRVYQVDWLDKNGGEYIPPDLTCGGGYYLEQRKLLEKSLNKQGRLLKYVK